MDGVQLPQGYKATARGRFFVLFTIQFPGVPGI